MTQMLSPMMTVLQLTCIWTGGHCLYTPLLQVDAPWLFHQHGSNEIPHFMQLIFWTLLQGYGGLLCVTHK